MIECKIDDDDAEVIKHLATVFDSGKPFEDIDSIPIPEGRDRDWLQSLLNRLAGYRVVTEFDGILVRLNNRIVAAVHQIENPPQPDYWDKTIKWWRSKPWTVPVAVIAVTLPLLYSWVQMIQGVLTWLMSGPDQ